MTPHVPHWSKGDTAEDGDKDGDEDSEMLLEGDGSNGEFGVRDHELEGSREDGGERCADWEAAEDENDTAVSSNAIWGESEPSLNKDTALKSPLSLTDACSHKSEHCWDVPCCSSSEKAAALLYIATSRYQSISFWKLDFSCSMR